MDYTREQELAVKTRGRDILVSAGAGAGKTRVLVSRIADLIMDPLNPVSADQLLVMTFTNGAAQEMKDRIADELNRRLKENPENSSLRRQVRLIRQADISTVHSFCSRLLRRYFQEVGLDPSFRIGEEGEMQLLRYQAMEDLMEEAYEEASPAFLNLVEAFAPARDDRAVTDMIRDLYTFSRGFADAGAWFDRQLKDMEAMTDPEGFKTCLPAVNTADRTRRKVSYLKEYMDQELAGLEDRGALPVPDRYDKLLEEDRDCLCRLDKAVSFSEYYDQLHDLKLANMPAGLKKEEKLYPFLSELKDLHSVIRDQLHKLRDENYSISPEEICQEQADQLPMISELIRLVLRYERIYSDLKKDQNVYDFDDLEHMTLSLLVEGYDGEGRPLPTETAKDLTRKYKAIFVDEYQDTNMVQETLIQVLADGEHNQLFTVGDVKQSIYRFRQARPDLFLNRLHAYTGKCLSGSGEDGNLQGSCQDGEGRGLNIELRDNFRSAPGVLNLCNSLFTRLMEEEFGGIDYDENTALRPGPGGPMEKMEDSSELFLLMEDEEQDQLGVEYDSLLGETALIAGRIKELAGEGYQYKDMVILLRSEAGRGEQMAEYLKFFGIPAACESRRGYFHTREVGVILNYLSVIDNIYLDIPMASVLLSPIGGFSEEDLACLKAQIEIPLRQDYSLYELMDLYADTGEDAALAGRFRHFLDQLSAFRRKRNEMPLHQLIWEIYQETDFYYHVLLMKDGDKRRENLNMLLTRAEDYEKTVFKGLFHFLRYMDQLQSYDVEMGEARTDSDGENLVRIMTIHKSKGLEFPVVFVSGLSRQFNFRDAYHPLLCHPVFGLGLEYVDTRLRIHHPSMMKEMLKDQIHKDTLEEELRILYVAMTRAERKLILTGTVTEKMFEKHNKNSLSLEEKLKARSYMDWILPLMLGEEIRAEVSTRHIAQMGKLIADGAGQVKKADLSEILDQIPLPESSQLVEDAFSYVYLHTYAASWKRKYSVSELKKLAMQAPLGEEEEEERLFETWDEDEAEIPLPDFLKEEVSLHPAARGTIVHKIMELLPFGRIDDGESLLRELEAVRASYPDAARVSQEKVIRGAQAFLFSPEGEEIRRMDQEGRLYKETPFTISIPASLLADDLPKEERVVVQGIIDAYGEGPEGLWLIDYKTDHIRPGEEDLLIDRYKAQMLYYKTALNMLVKKPVARILIYSFATRKFIPVEV
ncbi:MAG: helicase-exonuclease AddAB subunit AddA [Eubacterium sp.]|nr:helicase-exonuclease AddAB subunit AddA [Eubacterium sp.]